MSDGKRIEPRRLKGFRDYTPDICQARYHILDTARRVAALYSFQMVATPCLEYAEVLLGQGSDETDKQVYIFEDHGKRKVALRFDLTVPFARFVAEHQNDLAFPFRRMQIGEVWRGENTQKGRYREFIQCDIDIIGEDSVAADSEVLLCVRAMLSALDLGGFTIRLGSRPVLGALLAATLPGLAAQGAKGMTHALVWIDKLAKIGLDGTAQGLGGLDGSDPEGARRLLELVIPAEGAGTDLGKIRQELKSPEGQGALNRFEAILSRCNHTPSQMGGRVLADLSIARGLGYYTGVVYETFLDALPGFGSISSGGRYDDLASRFTNRHLPGVGGSLGVDRLLAALEELGKLTSARGRTIYIAVATEDAEIFAQGVAMSLREAGLACDIALKSGKLGNQFKFADRMSYPFVLTIGSDEVTAKTVSVKDMKTAVEQRGVPLAGLPQHMQTLIRGTHD